MEKWLEVLANFDSYRPLVIITDFVCGFGRASDIVRFFGYLGNFVNLSLDLVCGKSLVLEYLHHRVNSFGREARRVFEGFRKSGSQLLKNHRGSVRNTW